MTILIDEQIPGLVQRLVDLGTPCSFTGRELTRTDLIDSDAEIRNKIKRAVTDSGTEIVYDPEKRPGVSNLMTLHHIATGASFEAIQAEFDGRGYAPFKEAVADSLADFVRPVRERYEAIRVDEEALKATLKRGAEHARDRARKVLRKVYKKTGFVEL